MMKQGQGVSKHQPSRRAHHKRCTDSQVAQSEATAGAYPPPAYCVSPGFFINRSTEEGRADREVVLQEGVGSNRQAQRDPLNKYMIKKTHPTGSTIFTSTRMAIYKSFLSPVYTLRGNITSHPHSKEGQEGGEEKQDSTEERSLLGKENVEDFYAPRSTSCSVETSSVKRRT